jgi:hypothetical protein
LSEGTRLLQSGRIIEERLWHVSGLERTSTISLQRFAPQGDDVRRARRNYLPSGRRPASFGRIARCTDAAFINDFREAPPGLLIAFAWAARILAGIHTGFGLPGGAAQDFQSNGWTSARRPTPILESEDSSEDSG